MLRLVNRAFSQSEWTEIISGFYDLSLLQTWEYAEAKQQTGPWKVERAVCMDGGRIVGAVQAMVRPIPFVDRGLVWINRGPLWRHQSQGDFSTLKLILAEVKRYWAEERKMYLRIIPPVRQGEMDKGLLEQIGYRPAKGTGGWASALLDLSLPLDTLRVRLDQKWRNCLNKAERLELVCESGIHGQLFDGILSDYEQMQREKRFVRWVPSSFLRRLQACLPEDRKLWGLTGWQGGNRLGSILIARYGQTCEYLAGAVNKVGRGVNAGNFLLWRAICQMKEFGYLRFDLGGMDPLRTPPGIFHFKEGLAGAAYRLLGEFEANGGGWLGEAVRWRVQQAREKRNRQDGT